MRKLSLKEKEKVKVRSVDVSLVDEFGKVNEELKRLQDLRNILRNRIIEELGVGEHKGNEYIINVSEKKEPIINVLRTFKKLGLKNFLKVVSISITNLRKFVTQVEIEELTDGYKNSYIVNVERKK